VAVKFSNNGKTTLASNITSSATSISVTDGSVFPTLSGGDTFFMTLEDISGNIEIVSVTARSGNTLTVTRAQEGTTARAFSSSDKAENRLTAAGLNSFVSDSGDTMTGNLSFGDGNKAIFGDNTNGDLVIQHDGTDSKIVDRGAGELLIQGSSSIRLQNFTGTQDYFVGVNNGASTIYHSGSAKLATTSTGIDVTGNATFGDNGKAIFGAGSDLEIYHDGTDSHIDNSFGNTVIDAGVHLLIKNATGESLANFLANAGVGLFYDNVKKFETTSTGVDITGNATFDDNGKAIFGASSDLQIYHNGSNSVIKDGGVGNLYVQGTNLFLTDSAGYNFVGMVDNGTGGTVTLYHDNSAKLATTSTGIDVTGNATFDDNGKAIFGADSDMSLFHNGNNAFLDNDTGSLFIQTDGFSVKNATGTESMMLGAADGAVTLYHNNSAKLATTSTGIDVTGGITTSDNITMTKTNGAVTIQDETNNNKKGQIQQIAGRLILRSRNDASNGNISFEGHNSQEYARFNSSGYLGIGTSSPVRTLDVRSGTTDVVANFESSDSGAFIALQDNTTSSDTAVMIGATGDNLRFDAGDVERMRITSAGLVGIGTTSPSADLEISSATGSATISPTEMRITSSTQASDWNTTDAWGVLAFHSDDTSGGGAGNLAEISANMENSVGGFASVDFTLQNPASSYSHTSWLKLQNSSSVETRQVVIEAGGGLTVDNKVGIGTDSPQTFLDISHARSGTRPTLGAGTFFIVESSANPSAFVAATILGGHLTGASILNLGDVNDEDVGQVSYHHSDNSMRFKTNASERMRVDSSGRSLFRTSTTQNSSVVVTPDTNRGTIMHVASDSISGTGSAKMMEGAYTVVGNSSNTVLSIPVTSQGSVWKTHFIELSFVTGEYNKSGGTKAGYCKLSLHSLTSLGSLTQHEVGGNVSSVSSSGMNILINFTSGYVSGLSDNEGVLVYAKVLSANPDYIQLDNATFN